MNPFAMAVQAGSDMLEEFTDSWKPWGDKDDDTAVLEDIVCEFLVTDDTLEDFESILDVNQYPEFFSCFQTIPAAPVQVLQAATKKIICHKLYCYQK